MSLRPRMAASLGSSRFLSNLLMLQIHFGFSPRPWRGFTSSLAADSLSISCAAACRASSLAADSLSISRAASLVRRHVVPARLGCYV